MKQIQVMAVLVMVFTGTTVVAQDVVGGMIQPGAVSWDKFTNGTVTGVQIQNGTITADKLAPGVLTPPPLANNSVTSAHIANGAVSDAKLSASVLNTLNNLQAQIAALQSEVKVLKGKLGIR